MEANQKIHIKEEKTEDDDIYCHVKEEKTDDVDECGHVKEEKTDDVDEYCHVKEETTVDVNECGHIKEEKRNDINEHGNVKEKKINDVDERCHVQFKYGKPYNAETVYQCKLCDEEFRLETDLEIHCEDHVKEGNVAIFYQCNVCDEKFSSDLDLDKHCQIHVLLNEEETIHVDEDERILDNEGETIQGNEGKTIHLNKGKTIHINKGRTTHVRKRETIDVNEGETVGANKGETVCVNERETVCVNKGEAIEENKGEAIHVGKGETIDDQEEESNDFNDDESVENDPQLFDDGEIQLSNTSLLCDICGKSFNRKCLFTRHRMSHGAERPHECDICGFAFRKTEDLEKHMNIHAGEKPYQCDSCDMAFSNYGDLETHIITHDGEKPFKCDVCCKSFRWKRQLKRHKDLECEDGSDGLTQCIYCDRFFAAYSGYQKHLVTSHKCDVCDKLFKDVDIHRRIHTTGNTLITERKCLIHRDLNYNGIMIKFTDTSWNTVVRYASKWRYLDGEEKQIANSFWDVFQGTKEDAEEIYGYHKCCYQRFCDVTRQGRAELRIRKRKANVSNQSETETHSRNKCLRPNPPVSATTSDDILPEVCIICKKVDFFLKRVHGKRVKDKLLLAENTDAGLLREAATKKQDESILKHIRGKDCEAIEVCYHKTCYKKYNSFLYRKLSDLSDSDHQVYEKAFEKFSSEVIIKRIIKDKEILYMSKLLAVFKSYVEKVENLDASDYGSSMLRSRLQVKFPQLVFSHPPKRVNSEMVFVDDAEDFESSICESTGTSSSGSQSVTACESTKTSCATSSKDTNDLEKKNSSTSEPSTSESFPFTVNSTVLGKDTEHTNSLTSEPSSSKPVPSGVKSTKSNPFLYTSALKLRNEFSKITIDDSGRRKLPSDNCESSVNNGTRRPLSSDDCKSSIPIPLYNTIAWMIGASDEQTLDHYVKVDDSVNIQLLPILQDIVELHSQDKGKTSPNH